MRIEPPPSVPQNNLGYVSASGLQSINNANGSLTEDAFSQRLPLKLRVTSAKNCGTDHDPIQLKTLTLPTTIDLESSFNFSIDAVLHREIKAPLKVCATSRS